VHRNEEVIFAGKEVVEGTDRHLRAIHDVLNGEVGAPLFVHQLDRRRHKPVAARLCPRTSGLQGAIDALALPSGHLARGVGLLAFRRCALRCLADHLGMNLPPAASSRHGVDNVLTKEKSRDQ
jgi:hypothetical protein